jgi:ketosteroid isomerase-like protein
MSPDVARGGSRRLGPNAEMVLESWSAFWRGEVEAGLAHFAEDATWLVPGTLPASGLKRGHAEIGRFRHGNLAIFTWLDRQVVGVHEAGDVVVLEVQARGELRDGRAYENAGCVVWVLQGGKIQAVREYVDTQKATMIAGAKASVPDAKAWLEESKRRTGLTDFGEDYFREGLEQFTRGIGRELRLTARGELAVRERALTYLTNRLQIEDWYRRHPEIEAQEIIAPVFGLGLPRTGSTLLQCLLAQDPAARSLRAWESEQPCPPPETATAQDDPRIAAAAANWQALTDAAPEILAMLPLEGPSDPTECQDLLGLSFRSSAFVATMMFGYLEWLSSCDMEPAYRYHKRALKLLQWRCPPRHWRLKSPVHMLNLPALDAVYPDARFIVTHRDVARSLPSMAALVCAIGKLFTSALEPERIGAGTVALWERGLARLSAFRSGCGQRFFDLEFEAVQRSPHEAVAALYDWLGETVSPEFSAAMTQWLAAHGREKHGENQVRLEDYGLDATRLRSRLAALA